MMRSYNCQMYTFHSNLKSFVLAREGVLTAACVTASGRHLLVQYAAPWEKNTEMSEPMSPAQSCSCASEAGRPLSLLAAHRAVAALALPPPSPAAAAGHPLTAVHLPELTARLLQLPEFSQRPEADSYLADSLQLTVWNTLL